MKQLEREPDSFEAALRAERPEVSERFAAELDAWAAEGFPPRKGERSPGSDRSPRLGWERLRARLSALRLGGPLAPAAGLAVALVALVAGISVLGGGSSDGPASDSAELQARGDDTGAPADAEVEESLREAAPNGATIAPDVPVPPPGVKPPEQLKPGTERVQERTVSTTLSTEPADVDEVADGVVEVTERYDGIVSSSNVRTSETVARATFSLRIPAQSLQAFLADLSDLANVSARAEGTRDITAPFVSAEERFADAKAEVDALVEQLGEAGSPAELDEVKQRLAVARADLAGARTALAQLKRRAQFSQVSVTVVGDGDGGDWTLGDALDDALSVLSDLAGAGLVALAVIVPLGGLALLIGYATAKMRRRRRESALDD